MHGVDKADSYLNYKLFDHRTPKWTTATFDGFFKMAIANSWLIFKVNNQSDILQRLFIQEIIKKLIE